MSLNKPIVFLSHSSRDKQALQKLKDLLEQKTSGTVEFFFSSDGESIPFGRNWVTRVSEALHQTKLMFVFISPNSISSGWIFFEAGHAYSKETRVVPVFLEGLDLAKVPPPLSLLQGFNVRSYDHLNNLLTILNDVFNTRFSAQFTEAEYGQIFPSDQAESSDAFDDLVEGIVFEFPFSETSEMHEKFVSVCAELGVPTGGISSPRFTDDIIIGLPGASYRYPSKRSWGGSCHLTIAPAFLSKTLKIAKQWLKNAAANNQYTGSIKFDLGVDCLAGEHRIAAKLQKIGSEIASDGNYQFGKLKFRPHPKRVRKILEEKITDPAGITFSLNASIEEFPGMALIERLFHLGVFMAGEHQMQ
jgi:hypothetical protein